LLISFGTSLNSTYICKSDSTSLTGILVQRIAFYLGINHLPFSLYCEGGVLYLLSFSYNPNPQGSTTVMNTKDYPPQGDRL
jgi:hypothetical protein